MEVYLDNSATTRCYEEVKDIVVRTMMEDYGNPSAMHLKGVQAENYVKEAAKEIAKTLKVRDKEIYFTSGGTESDNWALIGTAMANQRKGKHIITTVFEHAAVSAPIDWLEEQGFEITRIPVDEEGNLSLENLSEAVREDTILVSAMYVNNELGAVLPVEEMGRIIKEKNPDTLFHVDAIQAYGKYRILPRKMKIDLLSVSSHKIHGPKGVGFLYIGPNVKIHPIVFGGEQQKNIRSGTENVPGIAGLALASKMIYQDMEIKNALMRELKARFLDGIKKIDSTAVHGLTDEGGAPHIISVGIAGVRSEVLLHTLEDRGIYVSSGSACSSNHPAVSGVLKGIGAPRAYLDATLRFSMSEFTTKEEIDYTLETLYNCVPMLRKYTRR